MQARCRSNLPALDWLIAWLSVMLGLLRTYWMPWASVGNHGVGHQIHEIFLVAAVHILVELLQGTDSGKFSACLFLLLHDRWDCLRFRLFEDPFKEGLGPDAPARR